MTNILVIDDEILSLEILYDALTIKGYNIYSASKIKDALNIINNNNIDLILLDKIMPDMDGIDFLKLIKQEDKYSNIPVIIQSAIIDNKAIINSINYGACYYLTKPYKKILLLSVIKSALNNLQYKNEALQITKSNYNLLRMTDNGYFQLKTIDDAILFAQILSQIYPEPKNALLGIHELLINSIEHGNLNIDFEKKHQLLKSGKYMNEIKERTKANINKVVEVFFTKNKTKISLIIKDQGNGFTWDNFLNTQHSQHLQINGRGIITAKNIAFDKLLYKGKGNEVEAITYI